MVASTPVVFEVVYQGVLDWRVAASGAVEEISFNSLAACTRAATNRARDLHLSSGQDTEVWAPGLGGRRECIIRFTSTDKFNATLSTSTVPLREACDGFCLPNTPETLLP